MSTESAPDLVARVDALLPQTQCTRCGYPACRPYAAAIAGGEAPINQCPPGGAATIRALASLLGRAVLPLNPANGIEAPPRVAWIDESRCIGCARCLPPCPVDAIIGAAKYMHTVVTDRCTGCELCIAPCPVDCIEMRPGHAPMEDRADVNRVRYLAHTERLQRHSAARQRELAAKKASAQGTPSSAQGTSASTLGTSASALGTSTSALGTPASAQGTPASAQGTSASAQGTPV